jgi:hypothetical protein
MDYAAAPLVEPTTGDTSESFFMKPPMEFVVPSFIFSLAALITSPHAVGLKFYSSFGSVMVGLVCLGVAGFALFLAIVAMLKSLAQKTPGAWYVLSALILAGASVFLSLMEFIASFTVKSMPSF